MALEIGSENAGSGMSLAIFEEMDRLLSPALQQAVDDAAGDAKGKAQEALDQAREGWKKLSYAVANGVIEHIISNMEIRGVSVEGDINASVSGNTGTAEPNLHVHTVEIAAVQNNIEFEQKNDGTGLVR